MRSGTREAGELMTTPKIRELSKCVVCKQPVLYSVTGIRFHDECGAEYSRATRSQALAIMSILALVALALVGIVWGTNW